MPIFVETCAGWNNRNNNTGGVIGGGQNGYNFQVIPTFVVGAEADFQGTSLGARFKSWRREDIALTGPPGFSSMNRGETIHSCKASSAAGCRSNIVSSGQNVTSTAPQNCCVCSRIPPPSAYAPLSAMMSCAPRELDGIKQAGARHEKADGS